MEDVELLCGPLGVAWVSRPAPLHRWYCHAVDCRGEKIRRFDQAEELRRSASNSLGDAYETAADATDALSNLESEIRKFETLLGPQELEIMKKNASSERRLIVQRSAMNVSKLRKGAKADLDQAAETSFFRYILQRRFLRYAAVLFLAGFLSQLTANFLGCSA